jgi:hypothetical protein
VALGVQGIKFGARRSISVCILTAGAHAAAFHLLYIFARFPLVLLRKRASTKHKTCMHLPRLPAYADRAPPGLSNQLASNVLRNLNARICTNAGAFSQRVAQTFMQILIVSSALAAAENMNGAYTHVCCTLSAHCNVKTEQK